MMILNMSIMQNATVSDKFVHNCEIVSSGDISKDHFELIVSSQLVDSFDQSSSENAIVNVFDLEKPI